MAASQTQHTKTHHVVTPTEKYSDREIEDLTSANFSAQAREYDQHDLKTLRRREYTRAATNMVATRINEEEGISSLLACACGTGRREEEILAQVQRPLKIVGNDISEGMCDETRSRGIECICANVTELPTLKDAPFDAATFLYAFGHLPSREARKRALDVIANQLRPGGKLFLDVFNIDNQNAPLEFRKEGYSGVYEKGDIFIERVDTKTLTFLHYFSEQEICKLLEESGFEISKVNYIGYWNQPGEQVDGPENGMIFIEATRL